jgi:hypothetical protein
MLKRLCGRQTSPKAAAVAKSRFADFRKKAMQQQQPPQPQQEPQPQQQQQKKEATPPKSEKRVVFNLELDGPSSIPVLTPMRASKKDKDLLGTNFILTPVRRSTRKVSFSLSCARL